MCACVFKCITVRVVSPSLALWLSGSLARLATVPRARALLCCRFSRAATSSPQPPRTTRTPAPYQFLAVVSGCPARRLHPPRDRQTMLTRLRCPCRGRRQRRGASRWRAQLITKIQNAAAFGGGQRVCVPLGSTTVPLPPAYWEALRGTVEVTLPSCNRAIPCDRYQNLLLSVARGTWQAERLRWRS